MSAFYVVETQKSMERACEDLQAATVANNFGVLHIHDLKAKMNSKGVEFGEECRVFEVCNPHKAARVLAMDMVLNTALPCRISVYTEEGKTKIGMVRPAAMLKMLSENPDIAAVADEVEEITTRIIDTAANE